MTTDWLLAGKIKGKRDKKKERKENYLVHFLMFG
ncbi:MAG: hypothetical protein ACI81W_002917, partial [Saprospiraceae bacterium]